MSEAIEWRALDGTRLWAALDGPTEAPPLILLHSIGCDHRMWRRQAQAFAPERRVVRPDARGHGHSEAPPGPYELAQLGRDVLDLLDGLELEHADVCGLSLGGLTAQWLALQAPRRVRALALANTAPRIGTAEAWRARAQAVRAGGMASIADLALERFFAAGFRGEAADVVAEVRATLLETSAEGYVGCCAALEGADLSGRIGDIAAPTLVVAGLKDVSTPPDQMRRLAEAIPSASYVELDAAHLSNLEQPSAFATALRGHLEAV